MNTSQLPKTIVVISQRERDIFLPPYLWDALTELIPGFQWVDSSTIDEEGWRELLRKEQPEILLSSWSTQSIPEDVASLTDGRLKYVCHLAGTVRKLVTEQHILDGLIVTNWGNSVSRTIAECGLMMAISCLRRAHTWNLDMHNKGAWRHDNMVFDSLFERRVGIHGFGAISRELRKLLVPFDTPVMTYSPSVPDEILSEHDVGRANSLEELFSENEVIFELAALTPKSVGIVEERHLRAIPAGGIFVNIGRGAVVDEDALVRVAKTQDLQIALDVFTEEPLPANSPFREMPNVLLTPHIAGPTIDRSQDSGRLALRNLEAYIKGETLEAQTTAGVFRRST